MMNEQQRALSLKAFAHAIVKAKGQVALSQILDCSQARISRMLAGDSDVTAEVAARIDKALKVPKSDLRPDLFDKPKGGKPYPYDKINASQQLVRIAKATAIGKELKAREKKAARAKSGTARAASATAR